MTLMMSKDLQHSPESWSKSVRTMRVMVMIDGFDGYVKQMLLTERQFKEMSKALQKVLPKDPDTGGTMIPASDIRKMKVDRFLGFKSYYTPEEIDNDY